MKKTFWMVAVVLMIGSMAMAMGYGYGAMGNARGVANMPARGVPVMQQLGTDADGDGICDECGEEMGTMVPGTGVGNGYAWRVALETATTTTEEATLVPLGQGFGYGAMGARGQALVANRGTPVLRQVGNDADGDGICDECGEEIGEALPLQNMGYGKSAWGNVSSRFQVNPRMNTMGKWNTMMGQGFRGMQATPNCNTGFYGRGMSQNMPQNMPMGRMGQSSWNQLPRGGRMATPFGNRW
ncbi:MAG TPA: hypothetical protein P5560_13165 [Thermotogota bacterium]|nr:hypothetical protein [Thermotogota bacterium]HRW93896.1 hypothetical protein [Thermotogota bacterium]